MEKTTLLQSESHSRRPWAFVPSLYFIEGLPYCVVMVLSVVYCKNLGISNAQIGLWTSILQLPWVLKPLWSPLVDLYWRKRSWIWKTQLAMAAVCACLGLVVRSTSAFQGALILLGLCALLSSTHDVAADGFYILSLSEKNQAQYSGVRNTFYRLAMIFSQGVLVVLAGTLQERTQNVGLSWSITFSLIGLLLALAALWHRWCLPYPEQDQSQSESVTGFLRGAIALLIMTAIPIVAGWLLLRFATPSLEMMLAGSRYASLVPLLRWMVIAAAIALVFVTPMLRRGVVSALHQVGMRSGQPVDDVWLTFFRIPGIGWILAFLLTYRLGEGQLLRMASPFLLDGAETGGLGLSTVDVGVAYGMFGVGALLIGGIIGGLVIAKWGLSHWLLPMWLALNLPNSLYLLLALFKPANFSVVLSAITIEQFGYGFGFSAYMMTMVYVAGQGKWKVAHYAIMTGFMALGIMAPGMLSGFMQELLGYQGFFAWVCVSSLPALLAISKLKGYLGEMENP